MLNSAPLCTQWWSPAASRCPCSCWGSVAFRPLAPKRQKRHRLQAPWHVCPWARGRSIERAYFGGNAAQDVRFALVEKKADRSVWEMTMTGPEGKPLVVQTTVAVARGVPGEVTSRVMQLGDDQPMSIERPGPLPAFRVAGKSGRDPRERVTVLAGAYTCGRVKETLGPGRGQDFWIEPRVHPLGVVKFEEWTQGGNGVRLVQRTWELMETGRGARRIITRPPRPFESDAFRKLMKP